MLDRNLVVRGLESYVKSIAKQLRSEEYRVREAESKIFMDIMRLKLKDEKKNLQSLMKQKEKCRIQIVAELGKSRRFETLMSKLRQEVNLRKSTLKKKYRKEVECMWLHHLHCARQNVLDFRCSRQ